MENTELIQQVNKELAIELPEKISLTELQSLPGRDSEDASIGRALGSAMPVQKTGDELLVDLASLSQRDERIQIR